MSEDEESVDPAGILRSIDEDSRHAQAALTPNARLLYMAWGVAWIVGSLTLFLAFFPVGAPLIPFAAGIAVCAAALVAAIATSVIHSARKNTGSRGPSTVQDVIYGSTYPVAFAVMGMLGWRLASTGVPIDTTLSYGVAASCLIVGILFLCGAAMWNDKAQLILGTWTFFVALASIALPPPYTLLAGVAGGVGLLAIAAIQAIRPMLTSGPITRGTDG